jgi:hypothetical protein
MRRDGQIVPSRAARNEAKARRRRMTRPIAPRLRKGYFVVDSLSVVPNLSAPGGADRDTIRAKESMDPQMKTQLLAELLCSAACAFPQALSVKWEELTAADFQQAVQKARTTCVLPFGIIEKHAPSCRSART